MVAELYDLAFVLFNLVFNLVFKLYDLVFLLFNLVFVLFDHGSGALRPRIRALQPRLHLRHANRVDRFLHLRTLIVRCTLLVQRTL